MKLIVAGYGFVGKAVANALKDYHNIVIHDPQYTEHTMEDSSDADGIIICVPTPTTEKGICDISIIANVLDTVPAKMKVLIKSTITPVIADELDKLYSHLEITYSPEFLTAANATQDFLNQSYVVLGSKHNTLFWECVLVPALKKCKNFFNCTPAEAYMVKYAANTFLATKVAFFNQLFDICEKNDTSYDVIQSILLHDSRIGNTHTQVPGNDGDRGFGGACFPKDTKAFIQYAESLNAPISILETAVLYNKTVRKTLDL